jgi:hypothetical protein
MRTHRFGRKIKLPATIAIKHEIRMRMLQYETEKAEDEARAEGRQDGMANCTDRSGGHRQSFARRKSNMNNITTEELVLLSGLFLSERTISGNERRDGMKRLVDEWIRYRTIDQHRFSYVHDHRPWTGAFGGLRRINACRFRKLRFVRNDDVSPPRTGYATMSPKRSDRIVGARCEPK